MYDATLFWYHTVPYPEGLLVQPQFAVLTLTHLPLTGLSLGAVTPMLLEATNLLLVILHFAVALI